MRAWRSPLLTSSLATACSPPGPDDRRSWRSAPRRSPRRRSRSTGTTGQRRVGGLLSQRTEASTQPPWRKFLVQVAAAYPQIRSVLVVRGGYLVYERYWHGFDKTSGHDTHSVTKSVIGTLVGIALAEGKITSLDQTVGELLATHIPEGADPRFATVTVGQLLTMTSGLAGDDDAAGADSALEKAMIESRDWVRHILGRRLEHEPGDRFAYSNASSHLLSAIVADASRQSTFDFARTNAVRSTRHPDGGCPRAEGRAHPTRGLGGLRQGRHRLDSGSAGLPLRRLDRSGCPAQDLAKLGYLYLNGGRWDGKQVVPGDYVATATSADGLFAEPLLGLRVALVGGHRGRPPRVLRSRVRRSVRVRGSRPGPDGGGHE